MTISEFEMCSAIFFEVYKGNYLGEIFGYSSKGPLIDKCRLILGEYNFGFTSYVENSIGEWILSYDGLMVVVTHAGLSHGNIKTVEEFFKIAKIEFKDII